MPMYSAGTASAPVSPTLRDTMAAADKGEFDFPSTSAARTPGVVVSSAGDTLGASASDTNLPGTGEQTTGLPASMASDAVKTTDFASRQHQHHHHHHRAPIPYGNPYKYDAPAYSLGGAHAYPPGAVYGQYALPPGTRRAGQRQVQGLGRAMPTWQEMQLHKQLKAERAARQLENGGHRHHHKSGATTPKNASMTNLSAIAPQVSGSTDIHQALLEMQTAMAHLTSLLPEGYSAAATPYTLTPAVSRQATRTGTAEHSMNGDAYPNGNGYGNGKNELKPTTSHSSGTSCSSDDEEEEEEKPNPIARFRHWIREPAAEFLGTAMLITFGNGVNNQFFLSRDPAISDLVRGTYTSISWCWGIGVMCGVYVSGGISGGHINPVVTVSLAIFRQFPWRKVLPFIIAQVLGAMTAAAFISLLYQEAVDIFEGGNLSVTGPTSTANLYTTFPLAYLSVANGFFQEFFDTAVLMIVILAIGDSNNTPPPDGLNPVILMFLIFGIGAALGSQTAYAINPARDLGPRLMLWCRGYGTELWTANSWYWITTPIAATFVGGIAGCLVYDLFIYTGAESPLNQKWEWRWSKKNKGLVNEGPMPGAENQMNEKLPAGGERGRHPEQV